VQSQTDLLEIVLTLAAASGFARLLHGWQQQSNQNRDDGNHHQQFNQRESALTSRASPLWNFFQHIRLVHVMKKSEGSNDPNLLPDRHPQNKGATGNENGTLHSILRLPTEYLCFFDQTILMRFFVRLISNLIDPPE